MSLEKFQVNKFFINELYNKNVFYLEQNNNIKNNNYTIKFNGGNLKKFVIVYSCKENENLSTEAFEMLTKLISALKLTMDDIALIDFNENKNLTHNLLKEELLAEKVILFGLEPQSINLPFIIPKYKVQEFNNTIFVFVDDINKMPNDKEGKLLLWKCLNE